MVNIFTCIFTGIIAACSVGVVLFTTKIYDGRNAMQKVVDKNRIEAKIPPINYPKVSLWKWIPVKLNKMKMNRIIRKSK